MAYSASPPPPPPSPQGPSTADFEMALASHIDESKPDPLARRQLENLTLQWEKSLQEQDKGPSDEPKGLDNPKQAEAKEIRGSLTLCGECMAVSINSKCNWNFHPRGDKDGCAHASLSLQLIASAKFIPQSQHKRLMKERSKHRPDPEESTGSHGDGKSPKIDRKEERAQAKIRAGMIDRLQKDYYCKRLLGLDGNAKSAEQTQLQCAVCEAEIKVSFNSDGTLKELEERVDVTEDVLEGIRRAILSQLDDNTSVLDLLLSLPYLINTQKETRRDDKGNEISLQLGHRMILRLLEDACIDACEREGEDELLDDLQISNHGEGDDNSAAERDWGQCTDEAASPQKKKSKR